MSNPVIEIRDLSKSFRIWESRGQGLIDYIVSALPFGSSWANRKGEKKHGFHDFYALQNVHLDVYRGQVVGVVGKNGSGKSTLLQIIAGTLQPSAGSCRIVGRVGALLELGSGFNPEFTGRENVYLAGSIIGISSQKMDEIFPEIAAFADIGEFIDQPVKVYSSGMLVRLAFAVQTSVEPDILIVDEALSVGDEAFSRKCLGRIHQLRELGATILLVSHSANLVVTLCDRAVLLHGGKVLEVGEPKKIIANYHRLIFSATPSEASAEDDQAETQRHSVDESSFDSSLLAMSRIEYEPKGGEIVEPVIVNAKGYSVNVLVEGVDYAVKYRVHFTEDCFNLVYHCGLKSKEGFELGGVCFPRNGRFLEFMAAGSSVVVTLPFRCVMRGDIFFFNVGLMGAVEGQQTYLHRIVDALCFRVVGAGAMHSTGLFDITAGQIAQVEGQPRMN
jgi:lipopolysaccharide transport system ATP-binding protein